MQTVRDSLQVDKKSMQVMSSIINCDIKLCLRYY